jgi:hypothetical protein
MKVIITENQLKLIKEDISNKARQILIDRIKSVGFIKTSEIVGGLGNLMKILNINSPMEFLHFFDDLDVVQSEEKPGWTLFRYKSKHNLMIHDRKNKTVHINYEEIWKVLGNVFNLEWSKIDELLKEWLFEVYNIRGVTPGRLGTHSYLSLLEVYNIKK